jgi:hypothetical protein
LFFGLSVLSAVIAITWFFALLIIAVIAPSWASRLWVDGFLAASERETGHSGNPERPVKVSVRALGIGALTVLTVIGIGVWLAVREKASTPLPLIAGLLLLVAGAVIYSRVECRRSRK